jgi:hypothetical protein
VTAIPWSATVDDGTNPLDNVLVWISTDLAGASVVTSGYTDTFGFAQFSLDMGDLYFWKQKSGYSFVNPELVTVTDVDPLVTGSVFSGTIIPVGIAANSYGSPSGVAALVPRYANGVGTFLTTDRPTLGQVIILIDEVSSLINGILAQQGFVIPVVQPDVKLSLDMFTNEEVASICEGINGSGRFGPTNKQPGKSRFSIIMTDVEDFILTHADGWEIIGVPRTHSTIGKIGFRDVDQSGESVTPIFERKAFDNVFEEWDRQK